MSRREQLEELLASDPDDAFLLYALAMEFVAEGDADDGLGRLAAVIDRHPDYVAAYFQRGQLLAGRGEVDDARAVLARGIETARRVGDSHAEREMRDFLAEL